MTRFALLFAVLLTPLPCLAADEVERAREAFVQGVDLAKRAQWAEALATFERSNALRPHPVTLYNMALCDRALGRTVWAVHELELALAPIEGDKLPDDSRQAALALRDELAPQRVFVEIERHGEDPVRVDDRALDPVGGDFTLTRGGQSHPLPKGPLRLALDPGVHEIRVERPGHDPAVLRARFDAGETRRFTPVLHERPGTLVIRSTPNGAKARIDGGAALSLPLSLPSAVGAHRVDVELDGYRAFHTEVRVLADARTDVHAELQRPSVALYKRWWFWTLVGTAAAAAAVTTFALTRPEAPPDGGSLGWVARP